MKIVWIVSLDYIEREPDWNSDQRRTIIFCRVENQIPRNLARQTHFPYPLRTIHADEYLSFRIIDYVKALAETPTDILRDFHAARDYPNINGVS